jgi:hypothetical protein
MSPTFEDLRSVSAARRDGATATLEAPAWAPPTPALVMPALFPDDVEVQVYSSEGGPTLVAAVELISPGNKDRDEARRAFAAKCSGYLQRGHRPDHHRHRDQPPGQPARRAGAAAGLRDEFLFPSGPSLYAVAYRPLRRDETNQTEVWLAPAAVGVGAADPAAGAAPRAVRPLDLETTYMEACQRSRLPGPDRSP